MKRLLLLTTLLFTTFTFSQYNLEFSRAVLLQLDGTNFEVTVPTGKVWKLQGIRYSGGPNVHTVVTDLDGNQIIIELGSGGVDAKSAWIPAGYKLGGTNDVNNQNPKTINAIEYSIVEIGSSSGGSGGSGGSGSDSSSSSVTYIDNAGVPDDDFTDQDGNTYGTTNINGMIWTTSNYKGSTYSDGTPIPYISDWDEWKDATTGAYTYWVQDASLGYGKLYNLHALRGRHDDDDSTPYKVFAPDGWHLPTTSEIQYIHTLYHSSASINIQALKSQTSWFAGTNGTNMSGLDVKPWPSISSSSNENLGFTSTSSITNYQNNVGGSTYFATSSPYTGNPLRMSYALYIGIDSGSDQGGIWSYTPFLAASVGGTQNYEFNDGIYVRLIKNYN